MAKVRDRCMISMIDDKVRETARVSIEMQQYKNDISPFRVIDAAI